MTVRGGGVCILFGAATAIAAALLSGANYSWMPLAAAICPVVLAGFADDLLKGIPVIVKLSAQAVGAMIVIYSMGSIEHLPLPAPFDFNLGYAAYPFSFLWILAVTNIYNFLDGIDGYAAGQAILACAGIFFLKEAVFFQVTALAVAGACAGFLIFNWHPAKIFMGDIGSQTLGFLFAAIPFYEVQEQRGEMVLYMVLFLWFFIADGIFTIFRRMLKGEKIWQAHRMHLYQELVQPGVKHSKVVSRVLSMSGLLVLIAVFADAQKSSVWQWIVIAAACTGFLNLFFLAQKSKSGIISR